MEIIGKRTSKIKRIILAEDDADDVDIFTDTLADITNDVKVEVFSDGQMLLEALENTTDFPDIVFLDLNMPVKNGFECLEEIKNTQRWNNVKVVILSTSSHPEQIKMAYDLGADLYLTKSTSYTEFKNNLTNCLQLELTDLR